MNGPLSHLRVLDLTSVLMGPYCTLFLADMGADVIKVEKPLGDSTRYLGPARNNGMGSVFLNLNRNKRSIVLDVKTEEGREALIKLVKESDVFVHSMRPQAMEKLGLSYQTISKENNQIIYCSTYGFSKDGVYGSRPAYDDIIQAASGLAAGQGEMSGTPQYLSSLLADKTTGLIALSSILAALLHREKNGVGQEIEVPMFESIVSYNMIEHLYGNTFVPPLGPSFYPRATSPYRKPYQTTDGYISVLIYTDKQWNTFFTISGYSHLQEDERFKDLSTRTEHIDFVYRALEEIIKTKSTKDWQEIFEKGDIPCMPVNKPEDLFRDPHLEQIGFFKNAAHPTEGEIRDMKFPVNFSITPVKTRRYAPQLGEHTQEILREVDYSENEIYELLNKA
ncbi:CaiB/BaiF CoA transferase family protein [Cytobacillus oceanisediminis]|uniref:CaiB/BaiF CoA transferase family protein n=1 Tax=Cytobacillus oceanisediminis TaxID=665099 RepID=UPI0037351868